MGKSRKELKPDTSNYMAVKWLVRRLSASATLLVTLALCFTTKVNCCRYAMQEACLAEILS